jgi:hypothetical protein
MKAVLAILLSVSLLSGCIPARLLDTPGISGTVVDAERGQPISGATVQLTIQWSGLGRSSTQQSTVTTDTGAFAIAPRKKWSVLIAGADYFPMHDSFEVVAPGYKVATASIDWSVTGRSTVSVETVRLERVAQ